MYYKFISIFILYSTLFCQLNEDLICEDLKLSYIKTDEAIGLLKSIGYNVIEFNYAESENNFDSQFVPSSIVNQDSITIVKFPDSGFGFLDSNKIKSNDEDHGSSSDLQSYLGGSAFPSLASGNPLQKLLICYNINLQDQYFKLVAYIKNSLDVGAQQIMIDALVLEIDTDDLNKFKVEMMKASESEDNSFDENSDLNINNNSTFNFSWNYNNLSLAARSRTFYNLLDMQIESLIESQNTEILSKPSVLVMDGRQARIQVGKQIPISKLPVTTDGNEVIVPDVEYIPVGIVLNLRPRISQDQRQVTMQIETIITETDGNEAGGVLSAPIINNRKVESYVRIANNTPFIIGGLISDKNIEGKGEIPLLSKIPFIGKLFSSNYMKNTKREVIVVITPHIIHEDYTQFSKVIPQDSDRFDSFGNRLFLNSYRLKETDIYDLQYITNSNALQNLKEKVNDKNFVGKNLETKEKILSGYIPGEEVFVKRMLYDLIKSKSYSKYINTKNVIFFDEIGNINKLPDLISDYGSINDSDGIKLFFKNTQQTFERPFLSHEIIEVKDYDNDLRLLNNKNSPTIILKNLKHTEKLLNVLILKYILELNEDLDLSLKTFRPGLEIIFPSPEILEKNKLLVDREVARFYYEVNDYYNVFEKEFNKYNN